MKRAVTACVAVVLVVSMLAAANAATRIWKPKSTAVLEVREAAGNLRTYHTPSGAAYWSSDLPVIKGDKVTIYAFVSTGEAALKKAIIRLDNKELKVLAKGPWNVEINTADLAAGYHFVEVVAFANGRHDIGTATFILVPADDPVLRETMAPLPAPKPAPEPVVAELTCRVRSRVDAVDQHLLKGEKIMLKSPALFWVQASEGAKEFRYKLIRDGEESYRSPNLSLLSHIMLQPRQPDGKGLEPGVITLSVQVGDGKGGYGPPAEAKLQVLAPEA